MNYSRTFFHLVIYTEKIYKHSFEVLKTFLIKKRFLLLILRLLFFSDSNMKIVIFLGLFEAMKENFKSNENENDNNHSSIKNTGCRLVHKPWT